jgi:hypothetical protein
MTDITVLSAQELSRLREVASVLLPGFNNSPAATALPELDALFQRAAKALGPELFALQQALEDLPPSVEWNTLLKFSHTEHAAFDVISTAVAGAYFLSTEVLQSIGYPTGPRSRAPIDLAAEEIGSGVLEPVIARGSIVRLPPSVKFNDVPS